MLLNLGFHAFQDTEVHKFIFLSIIYIYIFYHLFQ